MPNSYLATARAFAEQRRRIAARGVLRAAREHADPPRRGLPIAVVRALGQEGIARCGNVSGVRALEAERASAAGRQRVAGLQ
eukprot:15444710-Alexandrium_andersonii.AAC.1